MGRRVDWGRERGRGGESAPSRSYLVCWNIIQKMNLSLILVSMFVLSIAGVQAQEVTKKPDFVQKNAEGEITLRGVYTTNDSGQVIRYDLFDGQEKLIQTTIPHYTTAGRLLELREYGADGKLNKVIVVVGDKLVGLNAEGERIGKYDNSRIDMEAFLESFRGGN